MPAEADPFAARLGRLVFIGGSMCRAGIGRGPHGTSFGTRPVRAGPVVSFLNPFSVGGPPPGGAAREPP